MKVKREACWGGGATYQRLTMPDGNRLIVREEQWNRKTATRALDLIGVEYPNVPRRSIRFV